MKDAGLLYLDSHGDNNYIDIIYAATASAINSWSSNNQFIHAIQNEPPPSWGNSDMWAAAVESQWVSQNWSYNLNHNKSIVVLSLCNSYNNGWVEACNGGICFGYSEKSLGLICSFKVFMVITKTFSNV